MRGLLHSAIVGGLAAAMAATAMPAGAAVSAAAQPPTQENAFQPTSPSAEEAQPGPDRFGTLPDRIIEGVRTKSEWIRDYDGTQLADQASAVGLLSVHISREGDLTQHDNYPCTAWLVRRDLVLTAYHCMPGIPAYWRQRGNWRIDRATVTFRYLNSGAGDAIGVRRVVEANPELDYALLQLNENAPERLGVVRLFDETPRANAPLRMFHHPYGAPLMVLKDGTCRAVGTLPGGQRFAHHCDTRGGSSGAPVLVWEVVGGGGGATSAMAVGLHTTGLAEGLRNQGDHNLATSVSAIVASSSFLARIACTREYGIECPPLFPPVEEQEAPTYVFFDWDSSELNAPARQILDNFVARLANTQYAAILVNGHTDRFGSPSYSVGLSQRMADVVRDYLVARGAPADRITTQAFGQSRPLVETAAGVREPQNRRVEVRVCLTACDPAW